MFIKKILSINFIPKKKEQAWILNIDTVTELLLKLSMLV